MPKVPASMQKAAPDPDYDGLRKEWYARRKVWTDEGSPDSGQAYRSFAHIDKKISDHLWNRNATATAEDRAKHPKAKRNQPVPERDPESKHPSRHMP